jgi:hypothetical protein
MVFAVFEDLSKIMEGKGGTGLSASSVLAFFRTLDETLGSGIGWSLSPTSEKVARKGA